MKYIIECFVLKAFKGFNNRKQCIWCME